MGRWRVRLFHFSDDPTIKLFHPRPVQTPSRRPPGRDWLNGPLVWAIDDWHQPMYLFPRECPRILIWPTPLTSEQDLAQRWAPSPGRMIAHIEQAWAERFQTGVLHRYELPVTSFESLEDAGMWVARQTVEPVGVETVTDLPRALSDAGVALRIVEDLGPLRVLWSTTLHTSGIRLRNARGWTTAAE